MSINMSDTNNANANANEATASQTLTDEQIKVWALETARKVIKALQIKTGLEKPTHARILLVAFKRSKVDNLSDAELEKALIHISNASQMRSYFEKEGTLTPKDKQSASASVDELVDLFD